MDEIKSNKKAFGIYLGEPSTEQLNQFFWVLLRSLKIKRALSELQIS
ncbi:hypothetical protein N8B62_14305 (plasmid) [Enterococcus faecium]